MSEALETAKKWVKIADIARDGQEPDIEGEALGRAACNAPQHTALYYDVMERLVGLAPEPSLRIELIRTMSKVAHSFAQEQIPRILKLEATELLAKAEALENGNASA